MLLNSYYTPLIIVTVVNFVVLYMMYRDLNAVKASVSQISAPVFPRLEFGPPVDSQGDTPKTPEVVPSSPIELPLECEKKKKTKD